jgi:hypothetical protein
MESDTDSYSNGSEVEDFDISVSDSDASASDYDDPISYSESSLDMLQV